MKMRQHVEQLLAEIQAERPPDAGLNVRWIDDPTPRQPHEPLPFEVVRDDDFEVVEVVLPVIRSPADYATCLHEIGHIRGRYQKAKYAELTRERWAWAWVRDHALNWTSDMEQEAKAFLQWYVERARSEK